jgi:hypothetical protein
MGVRCRAIMTEHDSPSSTDPSEIEAVIARLKQSNLAESDSRLIERLLRLLLTLTRLVEQKNFSISRLKRMLFGPGADQRPARRSLSATPPSTDAPQASDEASAAAPDTPPPSADHAPRRGHGRRGAAAYTGARRVPTPIWRGATLARRASVAVISMTRASRRSSSAWRVIP